MAEAFKIKDDSTCQSYGNTPPQKECVQCFTCKSLFHALCDNLDNDSKLGTNTLIKQFHAASTKGNFKFFCDKCLTNLEVILAGSESQKINTLEMKVDSMENKLDEITTLLKCSKIVSDTSQKKMSITHSIWQDKNKLASIKAPPEKSVLVVKNPKNVTTNVSNQTRIEKAIMDNNIPVSQSYKNRSGDI